MKRMLVGVGLACWGVVAMAAEPMECETVVAVRGEAPSLLPKGKNFKLVWNDEFRGNRLDDSKWSYRTNFWGRRAHWFAGPEDNAVVVSNGLVHLKLIVDEKGQYKSPQLQTGELIWDMPQQTTGKGFWPYGARPKPKFMHRYGYYECRARLQKKPGWWSAFWMQTPSQGASTDPASVGIEHDIMESFEPGKLLQLCFHYNGYGADYKGFDIQRVTRDGRDVSMVGTDEFHVYGLLWEPDGYTAYQDGRQIGPKTSAAVSQTDQFVLLTTEAKWYRNNRMTGKGVPELKDAVGDDFVVDYVRVYDEIK